MTTDLNKAIDLAQKAEDLLQKSHVKQYTRSDGTMVKEHDDNRIPTPEQHKKYGLSTDHRDAASDAGGASDHANETGKAEDHKRAAVMLHHAANLSEKASEAASRMRNEHAAAGWKESAKALRRNAEEHDDKRITTNNEGYGYHGEAYRAPREHGFGEKAQDVAAEHYHAAAKAVMKHGGVDATAARNYLDAKDGRHLHDEVANRVWKHEGVPVDQDKGHHPDVIKPHIEPAIKEHFQNKWAKKALAGVVSNRAEFK